ncbi:hypothetical protein E2C01_060369 [Portunus trituberculatus]|uniref:Uncharacterized protein n=1 Tax=Portunus trituberculatus TaxID=210409 RepID=A0A5B7H523_PORTR|nr:hypothetical protein [Portunus trituberculatus]
MLQYQRHGSQRCGLVSEVAGKKILSLIGVHAGRRFEGWSPVRQPAVHMPRSVLIIHPGRIIHQ